MPVKRKRRGPVSDLVQCKRPKLSKKSDTSESAVRHAVLSCYYPQVYTLREYLLSKLPASSKTRRKKINSVRCVGGLTKVVGENLNGEAALAHLLDQTLVGILPHEAPSRNQRLREWESFSQRAETSDATNGSSFGEGRCSQSEVCVFFH